MGNIVVNTSVKGYFWTW